MSTVLASTPAPAPADRSLRVLIVDDEPLARLRLRQLLSEVTDTDGHQLQVHVEEAAGVRDATVFLSSQYFDMMLVDIQMPGINGMQWAQHIADRDNTNQPALIFVTAHPEHAAKAFELQALDYLTKPISIQRLQQTVHRYLRGREKGGLILLERGRIAGIAWTDVLYLKSEHKTVVLYARQGMHVLSDSLSELEQRWPKYLVRIHRSALVARHAVRVLDKRWVSAEAACPEDEVGETWAVQLDGSPEWLPVSRRQVAAVREALMAVYRS